jgi:hypothetical protein
MKRRVALLIVLTAAVTLAPGLSAYLRFGVQVGNQVILLKWRQLPVRYFITNRDVPGVTAPQLQTAVANGFTAWSNVPTAQLSAQFGGFVSADPVNNDGVTVIGFQAQPDLDRVLGATTHNVDNVTGAIIESDIFLNTMRDATTPLNWSVAANGEAGRFDVQSISTHEIGHLLGLGHSALGETELIPNTDGGRRVLGKNAVMFPIAFPAGNIADRVLKPDDVAGMTGIYPTAASLGSLGSISGRVTLNNTGVFGAHVTAFNPSTGALVGAFSLDRQGTFTIDGLPPGVYVVRVEPLDDGALESFFDEDAPVNINFKAMYFSKLVAVPAGGAGPAIEIRVQPK